MNEEPNITLTLRASRVEYIANVLAQRPYAEVAAVLDDIRTQLAAAAESRPAERPNGDARVSHPGDH